MARDGDNYMKQQLHRVGLDGKGDVRLTDPAFNHTVGSCMAGGGGREADPREASAVRAPAASRRTTSTRRRAPDAQHAARHASRRHRRGKVVAELATSDLTKFDELGLKKAEMFTYQRRRRQDARCTA